MGIPGFASKVIGLLRSVYGIESNTNSSPNFQGLGNTRVNIFGRVVAASSTSGWQTNSGTGNWEPSVATNWLTDPGGRKFKAANQTVTDSAALVNDTHLQVTLKASRAYAFWGSLYCTTVATSGVQIDFNNSAATVTNFVASADFNTASAFANAQSAALATALGSTALVTRVDFNGLFEVNVAGTFGLRFAQNVETGAAESVVLKRGSFLVVADMN